MKRGALLSLALLPAFLAAGATRQAINFHNAHNLQFGYDSYISDAGNIYYHYSYDELFAGQGAYPDPGNNIWNGFGQYSFWDFYTGYSYRGFGSYKGCQLATFPQPAGNPGNPYAVFFGPDNTYMSYCAGYMLFSSSYSYDTAVIANATSAGRVSTVTLSADFYSYDDSPGFRFAAPNGAPSFLLGDSARNSGVETFTFGSVPSGTYGLFLYGQSANGVPAGTLFSVSSGNAHNGIASTLNGNGPNSTNTFVEGGNFVIFENVKPDGNGRITITASPNPACGVGNANAAGRTDVNGFQLIENPLPTAVAATAAQNVFAGGTARFLFSPAFGTNYTFKWQSIIGSVTQQLSNVTKSDGAVISGVATTYLVISNVTTAEVGLYQCVITSGSTSGTSPAARLTILTNTAASPLQSGQLLTSVGYILQPGDTLTDFYGSTTNPQPCVGPNGVAGPPLFGGYTNGPLFGGLANSPCNVVPAPFCMAVSKVADNTLNQYVNLGANGGAAPFAGPVGFIVTPQIGSTIMTGMRFFTAGTHPESDPADYRLEGSTNGGSTYTFIAGGLLALPAQRNAAGGAINITNQVLKEINFANTNSYTAYRLTFTNVNNDAKSSNGLQIAEVLFLGSFGHVAPVIVQPPQSASAKTGDNVSFNMTASGGSLSYQWQFDGTNLPAATNNVLNLTDVTLSQTGTYKVVVTNIYGSTNAFVTLTVTAAQSIPIIAWTNPPPITYGTALTSNQLNATANVPGSFAYNPTNGTALNTGTNALSVIFTPTDTVDYTGATNSVSMVVLPAPLTVTAAGASRTYGQANPAFTGALAGLTNGDNITATYSCAATNSSPAGTYYIVPSLVDPDNRQTNYTVTLANGTLTVTQAVPIITWINPAPIIRGTALTSNQLNASANVPGSFVYSPMNGTVLNAGTNTLSAIFTPADANDYSSVTDSVTLTVTTLTLSGVAMYGATDTNGDWNGSSNCWDTVGGNPAYNVYLFTGSTNSPVWLNSGNTDASLNPGLVLSPGSYVIQFACDFQGWDNGTPCLGMNLYFNNDSTTNRISAVVPNVGSCDLSIVSNAATTCGEGSVIPGSGSLSYTFGGLTTTLAGFCASSNTPNLVSGYDNTPGSDPDFIGSFTLTVTAAKSIPTIVWTNPAPITYGTALTTNQLNATANVPGSFAYSPTNGTALSADTYALSVIFTPTDTLDYANVTNSVSLVVLPAPLTVTAASASQSYGQSNSQFTGTIVGLANGDNITATYSTTATVNSPPGTYAITPALVDPNDLQTNYTVALVNGTLTITQAVAVLTWMNPAPIAYGVALSANQLNATANVPGSFAYNPTNGSVLNAGTDTLTVIFTPADTVDYSSVTDTVSLVVSGTMYYVATNGADTNPGTLAAPWLTIQHAMTQAGPGDTINLQAGAIFTENVSFQPGSGSEDGHGGAAGLPVTLTSDPVNRATIQQSNAAADCVLIYNTGCITLQNLVLAGLGTNVTTCYGVDAYADNGQYAGLTFSNLAVSNFYDGIMIGGWGTRTHGFNTILIQNCLVQNNLDAGGMTYASAVGAISNIVVTGCQFNYNHGDPMAPSDTGHGFLLAETVNGLIDHCVAHDDGGWGTNSAGAAGLWTYDSRQITIQYCESYHLQSQHQDGDGFDLDSDVSDSVVQYCYAHDNYGAGFLLCTDGPTGAWTNNVVRYCISQNDDTGGRMAGLLLYCPGSYTPLQNSQIYGNTIYNKIGSVIWFDGIGTMSGLAVRNNLFVTSNNMILINGSPTTAQALFQGNDYWSSGGAFNVAGYGSLSAWQAATGQEMLNGSPVGANVNPLLNTAGGGGTLNNPNLLNTLTAYQLQPASPLIHAGLNLPALFGINTGPVDFYGTPIPQPGGYDIGAAAFNGSTATTVATSCSPSIYGQNVTFTATISPASGAVPTGTVQFEADGAALGSPVTVNAGATPNATASVTNNSLQVSGSPHAITAEFAAAGNFIGSTNTLVGGQTVNQATPTLTAPSASWILCGQMLANSTLSGGAATNAEDNAPVAGIFDFTSPDAVPVAGVTNASVTFTPADTTNYSAASTTASVTVFGNPAFAGGTMLPGGSFQLTFTGSQGQPFRVLGTNTLAAPMANWPVLSNGVFDASGSFVFTDTGVTAADSQRFYVIVSP